MLQYSMKTTFHRWICLLQRAAEVIVVVSFALIATLINLAFGWVAVLFRPSTGVEPRQQGAVVFPIIAKSSKQINPARS